MNAYRDAGLRSLNGFPPLIPPDLLAKNPGLLTAKRDLDAAKRFFRKMLTDEPLLSPKKIGTDGASTFPSAIKTSVEDGLLHPDPVHYVTKHLQQGIESNHFRVKKNMPKIGGFQSFNIAR